MLSLFLNSFIFTRPCVSSGSFYYFSLEYYASFPFPLFQENFLLVHISIFFGSFTWCAKLLQWCLSLCNPMDCSPPGPSVHGILQAIILEWVAMPSSRGSFQPRDQTRISCGSCIAGRSLPQSHRGSKID